MPNFVQSSIGVDTSSLPASQQAVASFFNTVNTSTGSCITTLIKFNAQGKQIGEVLQRTAADGKVLTETWGEMSRKISGQTVKSYELLGSKLTVSTDAIRDHKKALIEASAANDKFAASGKAKTFLDAQNLNIKDLPIGLIGQFTQVQAKLTSAFAKDLQGAELSAKQIQSELRSGQGPGRELGVRKEIQDALILLDKFIVKLDVERKRQQILPTGATPAQFKGLRGQAERSFPIPDSARLSDIVQFQSTFNNLFNTVARGNVTFTQFKKIFDDTMKRPAGNINLQSKELQDVQTQVQRVIISYNQMKEAAKRTEEQQNSLARSALLGFNNIARLVQAQILHRVLGNLITDFTQSVEASNKFQQSIGEILTIGDRTGVTFQGFSDRIRDLSIQFNKPPGDVAEAVYQALSNQILKTSADFTFMNDALKLSRTTASSAVSAVNALSSAMNAFNLPISESSRLGAQFFRMVDLGRFRLEDIQSTMGRVNVVASQLGVSFEEVGGTLTAITRAGVPLAEAESQLSGIFQGLEKPSTALEEVFKRLNVNSAETLIRLQGGFPQALRAILAEAQKVGSSVSEIFPNVRGRRGIGLFQSGSNVENDIAALRSPDIQAQADAAADRQSANVGERFKSQMNAITTALTTEFGPKLTASLLKLGEPFGGLDKLALKLLQTLSDLAEIGLKLVGMFAQVAGVISQVAPSLTVLGTAGLSTIAVLKGIQLATFSVNFVTEAFGNTLSGQINARLAKHIGSLQGVTTATNTATTATKGLGSALGSIAASAGIGIVIGVVVTLIDKLVLARDAAEALHSALERQAQVDERALRTLDNQLSRQREGFVKQSQDAERGVLSLLRPITSRANALRDSGRALLTSSTDALKAALGVASDEVKDKIHELEQRMRQARSNVRDSAKEIQKFKDEIGTTLFQEKLSILGRGVSTIQAFQNPLEQLQASNELAAQRVVKNQQVALIAERIAQLEQEAQEAGRRGDQASIDSARRKYEEIRSLARQQFNLDSEFERKLFEFNLRRNGQSGSFVFRVNTDRLRNSLDEINRTQEEVERGFQDMQIRIEAESRALLNLQRERERNITSTQRHLLDFSITNQQGELLQRFRGPGGEQQAITEFNRLAEAARQALIPVRLTEQELAQLRRDIGENQAAGLQRALSEGSITREQAQTLGRSVTATRLQELQQQLLNFRANEEAMRDLERRIGEQRNAIRTQLIRERIAAEAKAAEEETRRQFQALLEQRDNAARAIRDNTAARQEAFRSSGENLGLIAQGQGLGQGRLPIQTVGEGGTIHAVNRELIAAAQEAQRLRQIALQSGKQEDLDAFVAQLKTVEELYDELIRRQRRFNAGRAEGPDRQRLGDVQLTDSEREQVTRLQETRNRFGETVQNIQTAQDTLQRVSLTVQSISGAVGGVPANLTAITSAAVQMGQSIQQGLDPVTDKIKDLAASIEKMADALRRLNGAAPVNAPVAPAPGNVLEGFAEGGLIGGQFSNRGPDNRIVSARVGEMIMNPSASRTWFSTLVAMNRGSRPKGFSQGGTVNTTNVGDITINVPRGKDGAATARAVYKHLRRQIRRGAI